MSEYTVAVVVTALLAQIFYARPAGDGDPVRAALRTGAAVTIVMTVSAAVGSVLDTLVLVPLGLEAMRTVVLLLAVWAVAQLTAWALRAEAPGIWAALREDLRRVVLDCAVLGVLTASVGQGAGFAGSVASGFGTGIVFTVAGTALAAIRDRIVEEDLPVPVRGIPSALLCAALLSMAMLGLTGLSF